MWDLEAYPNGDFGFEWFFFYSDQIPGYTQDQLESFVNKIVVCDTCYGNGCNVNDGQLKGLGSKT